MVDTFLFHWRLQRREKDRLLVRQDLDEASLAKILRVTAITSGEFRQKLKNGFYFIV